MAMSPHGARPASCTRSIAMAWLFRRDGAPPFLIGGSVSIGRDLRSSIWLDDPRVSRTHCRIHTEAGQLVLADESSNGTFVNGLRVRGLAHLAHGDVIQIAGHTFTLQESPAIARPLATPVATPPPAAADVSRSVLPTMEEPVSEAPGPTEVSFQLEVVEAVAPLARYRDAVRLADGSVFAIMTDLVGKPVLLPATMMRWKAAVRAAGARELAPNAVLQLLNEELFAAELQATSSCAKLDGTERLLSISCAGTPPPWVVRANGRAVQAHAPASVALGRVRNAQFVSRAVHFERGDTLLLSSASWSDALAQTLPGNVPANRRFAEWLRGHPRQPLDGCVLCLTLL
jgi:hypothetical protein